MVGQDAILGMDFMTSAGIRLYLADGTLCVPYEVRLHLSGRKATYGNEALDVKLGQYARMPTDEYVEVPLKRSTSEQLKMRVTRGERWLTTMTRGLGRLQSLKVSNVSPQTVTPT